MTDDLSGWMVNVRKPRTPLIRQFVVAIADADAAIAAVKAFLGENWDIALGARVAAAQLTSRGMQPGAIAELGARSRTRKA